MRVVSLERSSNRFLANAFAALSPTSSLLMTRASVDRTLFNLSHMMFREMDLGSIDESGSLTVGALKRIGIDERSVKKLSHLNFREMDPGSIDDSGSSTCGALKRIAGNDWEERLWAFLARDSTL